MKKLFLAALLSFSFLAIAQEKNQKRDELTTEQRTELKVKKMTLELDLNTKQQQELKVLFLEEVKKMEEKKKEMKEKKEKGEKPTADERFEMKAKLKKILTPEQMSKFEKLKDSKPKRMHKKGRKIEPKE